MRFLRQLPKPVTSSNDFLRGIVVNKQAMSEQISKHTIHLIVNPTNRKKRKAMLNLGDIESIQITDRYTAWTTALDAYDGDLIAAINFYAGDHWVITKELASQFPMFNVRVWILSPGYGLIEARNKIAPYAATFSPDHEESVHVDPETDFNDTNRQWWNCLSQWQPIGIDTPRSISALSLQFPEDRLIIVGSRRYFNLLRDDLHKLIENRHFNHDNLYLVSAGSKNSHRSLARYFVPSERKLRKIIGGGDASLNIRTTKLVLTLLSEGKTNIAGVQASIDSLLEQIPEIANAVRKRALNEAISSFVEWAIRENPAISMTTCLKKFRSDGYACQEKRFHQLFDAKKISMERTD